MSEVPSTEKDAACPWCDFTADACRASAAGGYIKCCPDCDHRRVPPKEAPMPDAEKDAPDFAWAEMLTHQECAAKKHPDWFIDSEHNLLCPWCEIDRLRARLKAVGDFVDDMAPTYSTGEQAGNALHVFMRLIDEATRVTSPAETRAQSDPHATNGRVSTVQSADGAGA